jgi:dihydroflavonol-4-reductase
MKALVTGATGQLGNNLVRALLQKGWQVRALARSVEKAQRLLGDTNAEIVIGDMEDVAAFAHTLDGVDAVFHTAAYFREYFDIGDHWAKLKQINIDATLELMTLAEHYGVRKFIHTSSSGVIGPREDGKPADETAKAGHLAHENLYFRSKLMAEEAIYAWMQGHHMPVVLILPTVMIGPYDAAPTGIGEAIMTIARGAMPAVPPGGFEFVDSRDVAAAMIAAYENGKAGERYIISEGYHTMQELAQAVCHSSGAQAPRIQLNLPMAMITAMMSEFGARITGSRPLISRAAVRTMTQSHHVTASKARQALGLKTRSFAESIRDEVAWYRSNGYLEAPKPGTAG